MKGKYASLSEMYLWCHHILTIIYGNIVYEHVGTCKPGFTPVVTRVHIPTNRLRVQLVQSNREIIYGNIVYEHVGTYKPGFPPVVNRVHGPTNRLRVQLVQSNGEQQQLIHSNSLPIYSSSIISRCCRNLGVQHWISFPSS